MDRSRREDPKLSEVKAVLQRLQKISAEPDAADAAAMPEAAAERPRVPVAVSLAGVAGVLVVAGVVAFLALNQPTTSTNPALQPSAVAEPRAAAPESKPAAVPQGLAIPSGPAAVTPSALQPPGPKAIRPALEAALGHLTSGRVLAARRELLALVSEDAADVAWALARSYDPNFLGTIPAADAGPDVAQATRWYRAWYAAAVKQGLVADSVSLERIIGSMR